jgi:hypothetical protein
MDHLPRVAAAIAVQSGAVPGGQAISLSPGTWAWLVSVEKDATKLYPHREITEAIPDGQVVIWGSLPEFAAYMERKYQQPPGDASDPGVPDSSEGE